jgi:hypothetical protein
MKLYNYLESLSNTEMINANGLFLYNKIATKEQAKKICEKYNLRLLNKYEFTRYVNTKRTNFFKLLENEKKINFNPEDEIYKFFVKDDNFYLYEDEFINSKEFMKIKKDTDITPKNSILLLKSNEKINKVFTKLIHLMEPSINLYVSREGEIIKIICYDNNVLLSEFDQEGEFKHPILFFGMIRVFDPNAYNTDDDKTPFNSAVVEFATARADVAGSNTLYPIMAYFSENHLIIPDRGSVSDDAQNVWKKFLDGRGSLKPFDPIDDIYNQMTQSTDDDGEIYRKHGRAKEKSKGETQEIYKDPKLKDTDREIMLKELRKGDELNWVYKLKDSEVSNVEKTIKYLMNNHKDNKSIEKDLISKAYDLYSNKISNS